MKKRKNHSPEFKAKVALEGWVDDARKGMENALKANSLDVRQQYEKKLRDLQEAYGEAMLELRAREELSALLDEDYAASRHWSERQRRMGNDPRSTAGPSQRRDLGASDQTLTWFEVPRRTVYYKPVKAPPKIDPTFEEPIKALIEKNPPFGYRTVAWLLGFNKNTVQRIFQLKGWQVRNRPVRARPRIEALPSVAEAPNERWSTDKTRVWAGKDGWATLALVMDCLTRELLCWHLSRSGKASTAASALEHALIARFGWLETQINRQHPLQHKKRTFDFAKFGHRGNDIISSRCSRQCIDDMFGGGLTELHGIDHRHDLWPMDLDPVGLDASSDHGRQCWFCRRVVECIEALVGQIPDTRRKAKTKQGAQCEERSVNPPMLVIYT